jgi:hypothetical protein
MYLGGENNRPALVGLWKLRSCMDVIQHEIRERVVLEV